MRIYRDIAALAAAQVVCFLLLSHLEPAFFLLHFYQTIVYLAILIMLFYMEDRWAYMIGVMAPAVWLAMSLRPASWELRSVRCFVSNGERALQMESAFWPE